MRCGVFEEALGFGGTRLCSCRVTRLAEELVLLGWSNGGAFSERGRFLRVEVARNWRGSIPGARSGALLCWRVRTHLLVLGLDEL